jgi:protoporphyrinogen oxidase
MHLIKELGLYERLIPMSNENLILYKNKKFYATSLGGLFKYTNLREKIELTKLILLLRKKEFLLHYNWPIKENKFDKENFSSWFKTNFSESLLEYFAQPIVSSLSLVTPEKISTTYGLTLLNSALRKQTYTMNGGVGVISLTLSKALEEKGIRILKGSEIKKILIKNNTVKGVYIGNKLLRADKIVSSAPIPNFLNIINSNNKFKKLKSIKYSPCIHLWIAFHSKLFKKNFAYLFPRIEWKDHFAIIETSLKSETHVPKGRGMIELFVFEDHARQLIRKSDDAIKKKLINDLTNIFAIDIEKHVDWFKIARFENGMPIHSPNYFAHINQLFNNNIEGLYFCGDYVGLPSLEAAVSSGLEAAKEVIK